MGNKDLPNTTTTSTTTRIDSFSIEQAFYFEAYQESEIATDILQAVRTSNVEYLRSFLKENEKYGLEDCRIPFLIQEAQVPLNVRDRFGRTPLHHACLSSHPNFETIEFVIRHVPRMVLVFEDDTGNMPFDLIPSRCEEEWTQFLSETKNILHNNQESSSSGTNIV